MLHNKHSRERNKGKKMNNSSRLESINSEGRKANYTHMKACCKHMRKNNG